MRLSRFFRLRYYSWMRIPLIILGLIGFVAAVWIGFPMTGIEVMATVWLRATVIGVVLGTLFIIWLVKFLRRRKAAKALEEAVIPVEPEGDGKVLAERMSEALSTLKKTSGGSYLYDLPWYVIIGPPGAGKTTALANSGIEFPLAGDAASGMEGFGGTRYCDWWFAEDAILIDTAGRYTTQDSNVTADSASWESFLKLLKKSRPKQPINGIILAFSVEDMMTANPDALAQHAETVRTRLAEVHETLKIDFPVYVLFTKSDLISGFREYFSSFALNRRKGVWGVTFQTKDRKTLTHEAVPQEFDKLVSRLSDEVIDRLNEEPDGIARIAIFGLPGQMALMRDNVSDFLRRVFEPTRYKTNAILRGFYFTSGTQEGTPIDQVLGAMSRIGDGISGLQPGFMSGKGKSFFIHDLLAKVIFEERDWVSHDRKAVRRSTILRGVAMTLILGATVGLLGAFGYSYWKNDSLVETAAIEAESYSLDAQDEIRRELISDTDVATVLPFLNDLATMPAGYGDSQEATMLEGFGLGQRDRVQAAATSSYSDALEKMLRPRLILALERQMPAILRQGETTEIYRALKVYLILGGEGGKAEDNPTVVRYFEDIWRQTLTGRSGLDAREQLKRHLEAMLELDDTRELLVDLDNATVVAARQAIVQLPLVDQGYALIMDGADQAGLPDWELSKATGPTANQVFTTRNGADFSALKVPAVFTYEGFWGYFFPSVEEVGNKLREDQWVLGEEADRTNFDRQIERLDRALMSRYGEEFRAAWFDLFGQIGLANMSADTQRYQALGAAASASASPLLLLVEEVTRETMLMNELEGLDGLSPESIVSGDIGDQVSRQAFDRLRSRSSGLQRIIFDALSSRKTPGRVQPTGGDEPEANSLTAPIQRIQNEFTQWHLLLDGQAGQRPIDQLLGNLGRIWSNLRLSNSTPEQSAALMPGLLNDLTGNNSQLPPTLSALVNDAEDDFRKGATDASVEAMNRALNNQITFFCRETIDTSFPFAQSSRSLSMSNFAKFFGPGGDMDKYYSEYLKPHVERTSDGLAYRDDSPFAGRLSLNTLRQFERADRIRQAYFAGGSSNPQVEITVAHRDNHSSIESALLIINDAEIRSVRGQLPKTIVWPGTGTSTVLQFKPPLDRNSSLFVRGSAWTFIEFMNKAVSRQQQGDTTRAVFQLGGRTITYDFTINAITNPFTMRELREFDCPASVD